MQFGMNLTVVGSKELPNKSAAETVGIMPADEAARRATIAQPHAHQFWRAGRWPWIEFDRPPAERRCLEVGRRGDFE